MMTSASRSCGPAVVTLGRLGDITAAVPIAHEIYYQTGQPTPMIVAREYAPLLEAFSYISAVPFNIQFHRLGRTIRHFQTRYSKLHIAQMYATDEPMPPKVTPSFVTDAWNRAGMLDKYGLPLVVDRRNAQREAQLLSEFGLQGAQPYVVLHAGGISSPYRYRHELITALRGLRIIDIAALTAFRPQDILAILERASCAVLADSFPLHLSWALPELPVVALQVDKPTDWFGVPPRSNWIAKYRYEESRTKLEELASHVQDAMTPRKAPAFSFPAGAYNASILDIRVNRSADDPKLSKTCAKRLYTWRYHPNGTWETRLRGSAKDGTAVPIVLAPDAGRYAQEDARLFTHNGKPYLSYTLSALLGDGKKRYPRCVVEYGELSIGAGAWKVKRPHRVECGSNDFSGMEKNHVFWSQDGKLYCLYSSHPEQVVLEVEGSKVVREHRAESVSWAFGEMRGDVITPHGDKLLRVFHSTFRYRSGKFRYHIGVGYMSAVAPFPMLSFTTVPVFSGNDLRAKSTHHSKQSVVFTCGATVDGDTLTIPLSRDDDSTSLVQLSIRRLGL